MSSLKQKLLGTMTCSSEMNESSSMKWAGLSLKTCDPFEQELLERKDECERGFSLGIFSEPESLCTCFSFWTKMGFSALEKL